MGLSPEMHISRSLLDESWHCMPRGELRTNKQLNRLLCGMPCVSDAIHSAANVEESSAKKGRTTLKPTFRQAENQND